MAQKWYPVIDYMLCIECGTCTQKCSHGVYDRSKAPAPESRKLPVACLLYTSDAADEL